MRHTAAGAGDEASPLPLDDSGQGINGAGPDVRTTGLAAITTVRGTDPELDRLHVDTKPGADALTVTGTTNQLIGFTFS